jgi:hypothetical protein
VNLGQLIGELRMALAERPEPQRNRPGHADAIRKALSENPDGLTNGALRTLTGLDSVTVGSSLAKMPDVEKTGVRGSYVFKLKATE